MFCKTIRRNDTAREKSNDQMDMLITVIIDEFYVIIKNSARYLAELCL